MFEQFTERARKVMSLARQEAQRRNSAFIGTEHILLGIIHEGEGNANKMLKALGVPAQSVVEEVDRILAQIVTTVPITYSGQIPFSPCSKRVIELASEAAHGLGDRHVGTEHVLIAISKEHEGIAAQALGNLEITLEQLIAARNRVLSPEPALKPAHVQSSVAKYGRTGPVFKTPNGTLLNLLELVSLVGAQIVSPADARKLVWGDEPKS